MLEKFKDYFQPDAGCVTISEEIIKQYEGKVPDFLIDLWKSSGIGKYNQSLIELINPKDFESNLWTWLGREVSNYVPFAISGFGELFYYRKLTETDEDVCVIDMQYRSIETLSWSMEDFFEDFLTNEDDRNTWLRQELFEEAIAAKGGLLKNEVFTFVPILAMGGKEELHCLDKGNAQVYQDLVFQMTS